MGYCCRIFTPVQPVYPAASVRDFVSGALTSRRECCCRHDLEQSAAVRARGRSGRLLREPLPMTKAFRLARHARHWSLRAIAVTRLAVANSNMMLSSESLETGTGSSNSLLSTIQSVSFRTSRRIARNPRVCAPFSISHGPGERLLRRYSVDYVETYPTYILLGPWKFARPSHSSIPKDICMGRAMRQWLGAKPDASLKT
jgi:hypothetical protein